MTNTPNILWIVNDQHKFDLLSCLNGPKDLTPNLDALASDGILFENTYTPSPVCGPARACLKTGKYPAANGAINNWVDFNPENRYLPTMLKEAGYETGMAGKLHFFPPDKDYGFEKVWLSDAPYSVYADDDKFSAYITWLKENHFDKKGIDPVKLFDDDELAYESNLRQFIMGSAFRTEEEHETNWTTQCTLDFLANRNKEKPFFFYTSYFGPHQPYEAPEPYNKFYTADDITLPESYYNDFKENDPVYEINSRGLYNHVKKSLSEQDVKELVAANYNQIRMIDVYIGKIIKDLKEKNLYDNTFIIFTSDHGDHLGEHGLFFKGQMYDSCAKVPLIIKPCGSVKNHTCKKVVNTIDLYQTILELTKTNASKLALEQHYVQSRSLLPLLDNDNYNWQDSAYSIIGPNKNGALCMLRNGDLKLIRLACGDSTNAVYELYNLKNDPCEVKNIYEENKNNIEIIALKQQLDSWFAVQYEQYPQN